MEQSVFKDAKFFIISCNDKEVADLLKSSGAVSHPFLSESVRFAISDDPSHVEVGEAEELYAVPVVTSRWVKLSVEARKFLPFRPFHPDFKHIFEGTVIACSGLSVADRLSIWAHVTIHGGQMCHCLNKSVTHVVVAKAEGKFYEYCTSKLANDDANSNENNTKPFIVTPDWIVDCLTQNDLLPCTSYHPDLLIRTVPLSSPSKQISSKRQQQQLNESKEPDVYHPSNNNNLINDCIRHEPNLIINSTLANDTMMHGNSNTIVVGVFGGTTTFTPNSNTTITTNSNIINCTDVSQQQQSQIHTSKQYLVQTNQLVHHALQPTQQLSSALSGGTNVQAATGISVQQINIKATDHKPSYGGLSPTPSNKPGRGGHSRGGGGSTRGSSKRASQDQFRGGNQQQHQQRFSMSPPVPNRYPVVPNVGSVASQRFSLNRPQGGVSQRFQSTLPIYTDPTVQQGLVQQTGGAEQNLNEEEKDAIVMQNVKNILSLQHTWNRESSHGRGSSSVSSSETHSASGNTGQNQNGPNSLSGSQGGNSSSLGSLINPSYGSSSNLGSSQTSGSHRKPKSPCRAVGSNIGHKVSPKSPKNSKVTGITKTLASPHSQHIQQQPHPQLQQHQQPSIVMAGCAGSALPSVLLTGSLQQMQYRPSSNNSLQSTPSQLQRSTSMQHYLTTATLASHQPQSAPGTPAYIVQRHPCGQLVASVSQQSAHGQLHTQSFPVQNPYQRAGSILTAVNNNSTLGQQQQSQPQQHQVNVQHFQHTAQVQQPTLLVRTTRQPHQQNDSNVESQSDMTIINSDGSGDTLITNSNHVNPQHSLPSSHHPMSTNNIVQQSNHLFHSNHQLGHNVTIDQTHVHNKQSVNSQPITQQLLLQSTEGSSGSLCQVIQPNCSLAVASSVHQQQPQSIQLHFALQSPTSSISISNPIVSTPGGVVVNGNQGKSSVSPNLMSQQQQYPTTPGGSSSGKMVQLQQQIQTQSSQSPTRHPVDNNPLNRQYMQQQPQHQYPVTLTPHPTHYQQQQQPPQKVQLSPATCSVPSQYQTIHGCYTSQPQQQQPQQIIFQSPTGQQIIAAQHPSIPNTFGRNSTPSGGMLLRSVLPCSGNTNPLGNGSFHQNQLSSLVTLSTSQRALSSQISNNRAPTNKVLFQTSPTAQLHSNTSTNNSNIAMHCTQQQQQHGVHHQQQSQPIHTQQIHSGGIISGQQSKATHQLVYAQSVGRTNTQVAMSDPSSVSVINTQNQHHLTSTVHSPYHHVGGQSLLHNNTNVSHPGSTIITPVLSLTPTYYGHDGNPLPSRPEECLIGCVMLILGYRNIPESQKIVWRRIMRLHGAEVVLAYDPIKVTHVIIDCQLEEPDVVKQALLNQKRLVTIYWVNDILAKGRMIPPFEILHLPSPFSKDITFSFIRTQIISLTGFEGKDRQKIEMIIRQIGATFTDYLEPSNTLLVCKQPSGKKYETAQLWDIPCINRSTKLSHDFANEERERKRRLELDNNTSYNITSNNNAYSKTKKSKCLLTSLTDEDIKIAMSCRPRYETLLLEAEQKLSTVDSTVIHRHSNNITVDYESNRQSSCSADLLQMNESHGDDDIVRKKDNPIIKIECDNHVSIIADELNDTTSTNHDDGENAVKDSVKQQQCGSYDESSYLKHEECMGVGEVDVEVALPSTTILTDPDCTQPLVGHKSLKLDPSETDIIIIASDKTVCCESSTLFPENIPSTDVNTSNHDDVGATTDGVDDDDVTTVNNDDNNIGEHNTEKKIGHDIILTSEVNTIDNSIQLNTVNSNVEVKNGGLSNYSRDAFNNILQVDYASMPSSNSLFYKSDNIEVSQASVSEVNANTTGSLLSENNSVTLQQQEDTDIAITMDSTTSNSMLIKSNNDQAAHSNNINITTVTLTNDVTTTLADSTTFCCSIQLDQPYDDTIRKRSATSPMDDVMDSKRRATETNLVDSTSTINIDYCSFTSASSFSTISSTCQSESNFTEKLSVCDTMLSNHDDDDDVKIDSDNPMVPIDKVDEREEDTSETLSHMDDGDINANNIITEEATIKADDKSDVDTVSCEIDSKSQSSNHKSALPPPICTEIRITFTAIDLESRLSLTELCLQLPDCKIVDSAEDATHLVANRLIRTPKTYLAVALGCYVVTPKWIQASVMCGYWLGKIYTMFLLLNLINFHSV
ncbi:PAX-interacting protein 1 [Schistosoma japonicum]|nr:PAX-interacting protein 1 [Schistosoma japonicum]